MKKTILLIIILFLTTTLTGCTLADFFNVGGNNIGGVFKSYDFGENWEASNIIKIEKNKATTIDAVNSTVIKIDPQEHTSIYLGTASNGLWHSANAGANWTNILPKASVYNIALDPKNSGVIYTSLGNQIFKSIDLGKNWQSIYKEEREEVLITSLAIDPVDNLLVYFSTTNGEVYKTLDGGESWQIIRQPERTRGSIIKRILINPKNTRKVYITTFENGIFKSSDKGKSWQNLKENYYDNLDRDIKREYKGVEQVYDAVLDTTQNDTLIFASAFGLLKSQDGGQTWNKIQILTPPNKVIFKSLAISPIDNRQIYYLTSTTLYRTFDAGQTWLTSQLPSKRLAKDMAIDYKTSNVLYMAMGASQ